ncbi:MAG TPA: polysaccharide biosynthesis/export family protein [Caulobacteraceae bacterium]
MAALAVALSACATGGADKDAKLAASLPPQPAVQQVAADADYRIGPLDVLEITVPQVPEITQEVGTVRVSGAGQISLPLVGTMAVNGDTAMELQQAIAERLKKYVKAPEVSVFVKEYSSQRVTVEGEVNQPGIYPIEGKTTLLQALALAHGTTQNAKLTRIAIFRTVNGQRLAAGFDLNAVRKGNQPDPTLYGNDLVEVNTSGAKALFHNVLQAVPLFTLVPRP